MDGQMEGGIDGQMGGWVEGWMASDTLLYIHFAWPPLPLRVALLVLAC